jgi:outer membrane protein TolC
MLMTVFLFTAATVFAQQKTNLSLQDAIDLSIKNSKQLKSSHAKIDEAAAAVQEARDHRLPDAGISGSYLRLNKPNVNMKIKGNGSGTGEPAESPKPSQAAYATANVTMPLFSGFRLKYGIESAKYLEQAARLDAEDDKEAIILNTIEAYNNLYKAKEAVDLVDESLTSARQRVNQFSSLEKNGLLPRNELLKAQLQASNTELSLLDAQSNWQVATVNMNLLLGLPEVNEIMLDSTSFQPVADLKTLEEYIQSAITHRHDLEAMEYRKKAAATSVKAIQGEKLPSIALTGGYLALAVPDVLTVTNAINLGLGIQYSISSLWKNKAKVQQARAREQQIQAGEEMMLDGIRLQVNKAYQAYLLSMKKIDVYETAVEQATENFRIINNKYNNSLATTTELLEADVAQLQSKMNYAFAKSDAVVAYKQLLQSAGLLAQTTNNNQR